MAMLLKKVSPFLLWLSCFLISVNINAQVGIGTDNPDPSSVLDVFSNEKGMLIPRLTNEQRDAIAIPAPGLMIFNTTSGCFNYYFNNEWLPVCEDRLDIHIVDSKIMGDSLYIYLNNGDTINAGSLRLNPNENEGTLFQNTTNNFSTVEDMLVPGFLNNFGDGSLGNYVATNNALLQNNGMYQNLTIPVGVTAKLSKAIRNIIYVKDTLFLYGTIDGIGSNAAANTTNATANHLGASASGWEFWDIQSFAVPCCSAPTPLEWEANSLPISFTESFSGMYQNANGQGCFCLGNCNPNANGKDMTAQLLKRFVHFGINISGYNGPSVQNTGSCPFTVSGGQGGSGLYIIAKNIVFNGLIKLNGGDGAYGFCGSLKKGRSGAGGGGSCIIRTINTISTTGTFEANGGQITGGGYTCSPRGGHGAMLIIK